MWFWLARRPPFRESDAVDSGDLMIVTLICQPQSFALAFRDMATELGLRERKKLRTRQALSEAALRLFAEKGFDATTVEEICERAEVSPSTFFRYFESKEAAAFPEEEPRVRIVEEALRARPEDEPFNTTI